MKNIYKKLLQAHTQKADNVIFKMSKKLKQAIQKMIHKHIKKNLVTM